MLRHWGAAFAGLLMVSVPVVAVAKPAIVVEAKSGTILYSEEADHKWYPASLTKIMTAYVTFRAIESGALKMTDKVVSSKQSQKQAPSKIGLPLGAKLTVRTALKALIIKSANDVAVMLAERVAGSEAAFIARMNKAAARLGMTRTHFVNPNGLPVAGQVTTARDMARLARAVAKEFPQYAKMWAQPSMRLGKRRLRSYNGLLRSFKGADGMKTGFICDSGFNVVASATRDGKKIFAVVLGSRSSGQRRIRAAKLLEHGFKSHIWKTLFSASTIDSMPIDPKAAPVRSIRKTVLSWQCNPGLVSRSRSRRKGSIVRTAARLKKQRKRRKLTPQARARRLAAARRRAAARKARRQTVQRSRARAAKARRTAANQ
ncbi:MAG: D-alanyl-D-alanine carboxypeptidase family protein [Pseudomonadota bacterium]